MHSDAPPPRGPERAQHRDVPRDRGRSRPRGSGPCCARAHPDRRRPGVLRRRGSQGAGRRFPRADLGAQSEHLSTSAAPRAACGPYDRGGQWVRPGRRVRTGVGLRPALGREHRRVRLPRGDPRDHPRSRRHATAPAPGGAVSRDGADSDRAAHSRGGSLPDRAGRRGSAVRRSPARRPEIARVIAGNAPLAVQAAKRAMRYGPAQWLEAGLELEGELQRMLYATEDCREGIVAFRNRRPPRWVWQ